MSSPFFAKSLLYTPVCRTFKHASTDRVLLRPANSQPDELELIRRDYTANGGWETFLSYEDPERDILVGLLRLRKCTKEGTFREELVKDGQASMVRELHGAFSLFPI